jgi:hypothetical protein
MEKFGSVIRDKHPGSAALYIKNEKRPFFVTDHEIRHKSASFYITARYQWKIIHDKNLCCGSGS